MDSDHRSGRTFLWHPTTRCALVETIAQFNAMRELGCAFGQAQLGAPALPAAEFLALALQR
ncbi:hypothetical protein Rmet_6762 (plasmid) [Cupriavidus metallidurans CH34]|uniref:Uncharacterized protein n=1 Tax=Cupriavidus metallidurans (strain ATCC 43123 / DSM 2839 / NBRC 102507 / CH34) TaxID=266264 RepID=D3DYH1_CUPMC|nr:hypothetical protein Rmet_6762 [Cupriavidus metallidurans CH34]